MANFTLLVDSSIWLKNKIRVVTKSSITRELDDSILVDNRNTDSKHVNINLISSITPTIENNTPIIEFLYEEDRIVWKRDSLSIAIEDTNKIFEYMKGVMS